MTSGDRIGSFFGRAALALGALGLIWSATVMLPSCSRAPEPPRGRSFATPEEAVKALAAAVKASSVNDVLAIFGPDANDLVSSADPVIARQNREVFAAAAAERWQLVDEGPDSKTLVVGNESWPFPIPLVHDANGWRFDTAAGRDEVLARRIGRNELAVIGICRTYVAAQRLYAGSSHDGQPAGIFARTFRSDSGRQNGLYWPARAREKRSPLGELVADAAGEGRSPRPDGAGSSPFHGYYFRILTAQGPDAPGGAKDYLVSGALSRGFGLVAWPAQYDSTGVMTFIVNHEGVVHERDLGPGTDAACRAMDRYNPDRSWSAVQ